jgi:hypothetical protein
MNVPSINEQLQKPAAHTLHCALKTGLYTGALLIIVTLGALVAANRIPGLDQYALERNAASYSLFVMIMLIPVLRFLKRPLQLFISAMIGWAIFVVVYDIEGMVFSNLFNALRHTPFKALVEGALIYGVLAAGSWVGGMCFQARHHPIAPPRHRAPDATSHQQ